MVDFSAVKPNDYVKLIISAGQVTTLELLDKTQSVSNLTLTSIDTGVNPIVINAVTPAGEAVSRYEAPRGEDIHYTRSNGTDIPERVKVRAPTLANLASITYMIEGGYLADVPIIIAAIDPCFSCTDRMIRVTDANSGEQQRFDWEGLRKYSIDWYSKRGIVINDR